MNIFCNKILLSFAVKQSLGAAEDVVEEDETAEDAEVDFFKFSPDLAVEGGGGGRSKKR